MILGHPVIVQLLHRKVRSQLFFEALLAWIQFDLESRSWSISPLIDEVQFHCLSGPKIVESLLSNKLIKGDSHSVDILEQALYYHNLDYEQKCQYWVSRNKPSRWPKLMVCLSYAEKILQSYDFVSGDWSVLSEKPDWVFGAEMVSCDQKLFTIGGRDEIGIFLGGDFAATFVLKNG